LFIERLGPARRTYDELSKNLDHVEQVLADGGRRARAVAVGVLDEVHKATGIQTSRVSVTGK